MRVTVGERGVSGVVLEKWDEVGWIGRTGCWIGVVTFLKEMMVGWNWQWLLFDDDC